MPDLDFICESENRLWGCSNETRTIYASALGDPTNFFSYQGLSTDSYAVAVGSEGRGLSAAVLAVCDRTVRIPMDPRCESLNAASAASVLLWEAARGDY